jgi:hypothetical protein
MAMKKFMPRNLLSAVIVLMVTVVLIQAIDYYKDSTWADFAKAKGISSTEGVAQFRCAANELYYVVPTGKITDTAFKYNPTITCNEDETESVNEAGKVLRGLILIIAVFFFIVLVVVPVGNKQGEQQHD